MRDDFDEGVALIRAGIDVLVKADPAMLSAVELTAVLVEVETQRRRAEAVDQRLLAGITAQGVAGEYGYASVVALLVDLLRVSPGQAKGRVARARDLGPRRDLGGQPLEPILAVVADAQQCGAISAEHVDVITRCLDQIPAHAAAEFDRIVEQALVEQALHAEPRQVARTGQLLLARLDQDGPEPDWRERDAQRRREVSLHVHPDGTGILTGRLTPAASATWRVILDALSAPHPSGPDGTAGPDGECSGHGGAGEPDDRSPGQRRHDGFLDAGQRLLRSATLPDSGGTPVTILVSMTVDDLRRQTGFAQTARGDLISVSDLLHLAAEADLIPAVLDASGGVLCYGRTRRLATPGQRHALALRDRGCSFPACDRPPGWAEAHHVVPWQDGGPTDLDNLTLLCGHHHREFQRRGWTVHMNHGIPEWIPPAWLDNERTPRRNAAHHLREITFDELAEPG